MTDPEHGLVSEDSFLDGRLKLNQPRNGYRAGMDAVLLAAAVPARAGEQALDLGCGVGTAALCLAWRVPGLAVTGLELQDEYAALARRNAAINGLPLDVIAGDVTRQPPALRQSQFDHVLINPPYFLRSDGSASPDPGRDMALAGATPLAAWLDAAARRLRPGGSLTMIQRAERLPDIMAALDTRFGAVRLLPLAPRAGTPARLVLLGALKGRRTPFRLLAPMVLHDGAFHASDAPDYTPQTLRILREGAPLPVFEPSEVRDQR